MDPQFDLLKDCSVFCLCNGDITTQKQADAYEQMVISFFGLDNLLNIQLGGLNSSFYPGEAAFQSYKKRNHKFFPKYIGISNMVASLSMNDYMEKKADVWTNVILNQSQSFKQKNLDMKSYSTEYIQVIKEQATPSISLSLASICGL